MKVQLDLIPMALCGLATIVAVAVILVLSHLLRRAVLLLIAKVDRGRRSRVSPSTAKTLARRRIGATRGEPPDDSDVTALPG